ncbi:Isochorismatase-like protein [Crassisporium funariophilum]|nr:Isochorismatase-like protein [Crassisporium funariophilum]
MSATEYTAHAQGTNPATLAKDDANKRPSTSTSVSALVVIDMQNDFVTGSLPVPDGASIVAPINHLMNLPFTLKIATRDFHPANHISFADTHNKPVLSTATIYHPEDKGKTKGMKQVLWPVHCVVDTDGADFVPGLKSDAFDAVIDKGTHAMIESYSAFRDIWGRKETDLPGLLAGKGVTDVYFVGVAGDYCVKWTAVDAVEYGYKVWLVGDAIRSISDQESTFDELGKKGIKFTSSQELVKLMSSVQK